MTDQVKSPSHYTAGDGIECIDYIRQVMNDAEFAAFCRGNVIKYQHRHHSKGTPVQDLRKAAQYLQWQIEATEKMQ